MASVGIFGLFMTVLFLEHATTAPELSQGLMGRKSLEKDHGMLFHFPETNRYSLWSYGCYIPLSVAYLDEGGTITEIYELEAFPDKWEQEGEEATDFFLSHAVNPRLPAAYALEMAGYWFQQNGVKVGDQLRWEGRQAEILAK